MSAPESAERMINVANHRYTLDAAPDETGEGWTAHIARYEHLAGAEMFRRPILDARSPIHDQVAIMWDWRGTGATADAAIDDLEAQLREVITDALRLDPSRPRHERG